MRRRELFRAAGWLGAMAVVPVAGCAAGSAGAKSGAPVSGSRSIPPATSASTAASAGAEPSTTSASTDAPAGAGPSTPTAGGRLVQADLKRRTPVPAAAARARLLPVAAKLYRAALPGTGNAVLSPYSIVSALGMLALGARGATATSLATVLGGEATTVADWLGSADAALARAVAASQQSWGGSAPNPAVIDPANVLFLQQDAQVRAAYLAALASEYGAGVRQLDFADSDAAEATINAWVAQRTHNLIPHLLPPGFVDAATLLVLVNALYLKSAWATAFQPGGPKQSFTTAAGGTVAVPLMTLTAQLQYATGSNWQAVSIPLLASLAMTVIVPHAGSFGQVSGALDARLLAAATSGETRSLQLAMPSFRADTPTDLVAPLTALGLGALFHTPDLSGIAGPAGQLFVSGVIHQARIAVDDKGVEAAAASAVGVEASSLSALPPVQLRVDRPFLYLIHDVETVAPLFLGRVTDPTA